MSPLDPNRESPPNGLWEERARRWLAEPTLQVATSAAVFGLIAVVSAAQLHANWAGAGVDAAFGGLVGLRLLEWWLWAIAVPQIVRLDARLRRARPRWPGVLGVHVLAATAWFALLNALMVELAPLVDPEAVGRPFMQAYLERGMVRLTTAWVVYASILAVVALVRDFVRRQSLTRDLYDAQLRALRAQLQPHFLFNTLNTVAALVRSGDRERAIGTLVALSELLRRSLGHTRENEVLVEEELEFLKRYVDIQKARFGERLSVAITADRVARSARVPPLVLQPLVENAIRHGLDLDHDCGSVAVSVFADGTRLRIRVEDDGGALGREPNGAGGAGEGGLGLANLRDRLARLYGREQSLELGLTEGGATAVTITIPMRRG
jgi:hypothetical protein